jgi:hypothetical protein
MKKFVICYAPKGQDQSITLSVEAMGINEAEKIFRERSGLRPKDCSRFVIRAVHP